MHGQDETAVSGEEAVWKSLHTQWLLKDSLSKWRCCRTHAAARAAQCFS